MIFPTCTPDLLLRLCSLSFSMPKPVIRQRPSSTSSWMTWTARLHSIQLWIAWSVVTTADMRSDFYLDMCWRFWIDNWSSAYYFFEIVALCLYVQFCINQLVRMQRSFFVKLEKLEGKTPCCTSVYTRKMIFYSLFLAFRQYSVLVKKISIAKLTPTATTRF